MRETVAEDPSEPVELYRARGAGEAHALRTHLEDAGIPARVENELLQGVVGEVPGGWVTAPRVLVSRGRLDAARSLLAAFLRQADDPDEPGGRGELRCLACRTPMGAADTCPACGWSYASDPGTDPAPELAALVPAPAPEPEPPRAPTVPAFAPVTSRRALWAEVAAVLAVGVIPYCLAVVPGPVVAPAPYWADTIHLTVSSACVVFVTLYLIRRSGEPVERFGLESPAASDLLLGFGMLVVAELVWLIELRFGLSGYYPFAAPSSSMDYALMGVKYGTAGFAEELVTRGYLITRLEVLLRSRLLAVLLAAAAFASYHAYQGPSGLVGAFLFGLTYGLAYLVIRRVWPLAIGHVLFNIHMDLLSVRP